MGARQPRETCRYVVGFDPWVEMYEEGSTMTFEEILAKSLRCSSRGAYLVPGASNVVRPG